MAKLKSQAIRVVELKEHEYLQLVENTIKLEALKIAGIEKMAIYKAMEHIFDIFGIILQSAKNKKFMR